MTDATAEAAPSPFHSGEIALQARLGVAERMDRQGRAVVRPYMPDQHRAFFEALPFLMIGVVDDADRPWASIVPGKPGFLSSPDATTLAVGGLPVTGDPARAAIREGRSIGGLGIMLENRRRNRLNGHVVSASGDGFAIAVDQAFGNCPQYIQTRAVAERPAGAPRPRAVETLGRLDAAASDLIGRSDTCFIASFADVDDGAGPERQVDVSHRGGRPGFVRVDDQETLTLPDYLGNFHFNTLGNLELNGRAGLLFVDFDSGDMLTLTGRAEIVWEDPDLAHFKGAERLVRFRLDAGVRLVDALPLAWAFDQFSPNSLLTGSWEEAARTRAAEAKRSQYRPYRVARVVGESAVIRSFFLEPDDGDGLPRQQAGQFLPIRLEQPGGGEPMLRTYTVSSAPGDPGFRLSVKRDGAASTLLHDGIHVGSRIDAMAPRGGFVLDTSEKRPAVLISAGVGITPMISMLRNAVKEGVRTRHMRPIWFIHGARTSDERAFYAEAARLAEAAGGSVKLHFALSRPGPDDDAGRDYQSVGHVSADLLRSVLPFDDFDFYLCGPAPMMQSLYEGLRALGVRDHRIFAEGFGPASLRRSLDEAPSVAAATAPVPVQFKQSALEAEWTPACGTLLELAEAKGLSPAFGCRSGACGTCAAGLLKGGVSYREAPSEPPAEGQVLLCSAIPAAGAEADGGIVIDI